MKTATKLAMIGSGIILLIEILYKVIYLFDFNYETQTQFYSVLSIFQLISAATLFNFFYILYKKQNNTSSSNE